MIARNLMPEGVLTGTWARKNINHPLQRAIDDIKKDPTWEKPMEEMGFGNHWFPIAEEQLSMALQQKFKMVAIEPKTLCRTFKDKEAFTAFFGGMLGDFLNLKLLDSTQQKALLALLVEKYLKYSPENEDKTITYSLDVSIFTAQKPIE